MPLIKEFNILMLQAVIQGVGKQNSDLMQNRHTQKKGEILQKDFTLFNHLNPIYFEAGADTGAAAGAGAGGAGGFGFGNTVPLI